MNRKVYSQGGQGELYIPSSKSDAHRILIAAALAKSSTKVVIRGMSKDISATMNCLRALGSEIEPCGEAVWKVEPIRDSGQDIPKLICGESGSTLRFLLPVAAAVTDQFEMDGEGRLPERPITELSEQMMRQGCIFSAPQLPFQVTGKLKGGTYQLPGNISSQYITGLLFALPLLPEDSRIVLSTELESRAYVGMTIATLKRFGIQIETFESEYRIPGRQKYISPGTIEAEGDWSNAAFFLALGAVKGPVTCKGLRNDSGQADYAILDILRQFGAEVSVDEDITVSGGSLKGIEIDAAEFPDLVPVLSVVAAAAGGTTRIFHAERLRIKESDRLAAMCDCLTRAGVQVQEQPDGLIIRGKDPGSGSASTIRVSGYNDHRIVMAMAVAAIALNKEIIIEESEAVEKSYPAFFEAWEQTGGKSHVI